MPEPTCPICGKPPGGPSLRPFCSQHCAQVDLGRWFTGAYAIPVPEREEDDLHPDT